MASDDIGRAAVFVDRYFRVQVPLPIVTGKFEDLTDEELNEHAADINAELGRRGNASVPEPGTDG